MLFGYKGRLMAPEEGGAGASGGAGGVGDADTDKKETPALSNSDVKKHPLFLKVTEQLAALTAAEEKRKQDEAAAKTEAERKKLEGKAQYEEALANQEKEFKAKLAELEKGILEKDLTNELLRAGFKNSVFNDGAIHGYTAEKGTVSEYVKALSEAEENKIFLDTGKGAGPKRKDVGTPTSNTKQMTPAELTAALKDPDPKVRAQARQQARENWKKTGSTGVEPS